VTVDGPVKDLLVSVLLCVKASSSRYLGGLDGTDSARRGSVLEGGVVVVVVVVQVGSGVVVVGVAAVVVVDVGGIVRGIPLMKGVEKEMSE